MKERNYGIDLLRIFSMFLVAIVHTLGHGGVLGAAAPGSANAYAALFLKAVAICAVNCFAIITGFVMCEAKPRISKALQLWAQVAFYAICITALCYVLFPGEVGYVAVFNAFLPVSRGQYWFITAYMGMYLLMPFLNIAVQKLEKKTYAGMLVMFFVAFSLLPTVFNSNMFYLNGGYSTIWLCLMYLVGAYLRKFDSLKKASRSKLFLSFGICVSLTFLSKVVLAWVGKTVLGRTLPEDMFYQYVSPTVVLSAVFLVGVFSKISLGDVTKKVVGFFAPAALGVYLIHDHILVRMRLWEGVGQRLVTQNTGVMVLAILGIALSILLACLLIDRLRVYLFQCIRIPALCQKIENRLNRCWNKWNKE